MNYDKILNARQKYELHWLELEVMYVTLRGSSYMII